MWNSQIFLTDDTRFLQPCRIKYGVFLLFFLLFLQLWPRKTVLKDFDLTVLIPAICAVSFLESVIVKTIRKRRLQMLTLTKTHHQPFQSALHGATLTDPTAVQGSWVTSSFLALGEERAARNEWPCIWLPQRPGTGWTWSPLHCSTWSDSLCSWSGQTQRWSPVDQRTGDQRWSLTHYCQS